MAEVVNQWGETNEQRATAFRDAINRYLGFNPEQKDVDAFLARPDISITQRIREIMAPDTNYRSRLQERAANVYTPALNDLDRSKSDLETQYQSLIQGLEKRQRDLPEEITNQWRQKGQMRSNRAQQALTEGMTSLKSQFANADVQRATRLADLASQRANLMTQQQDLYNQLMTQDQKDVETGNLTNMENALKEKQLQAQLAAQQAAQRSIITSGGQQRMIDSVTGDTIRELGAAGSPAQLAGIIGGLQPDQIDAIPDSVLEAIMRNLGM